MSNESNQKCYGPSLPPGVIISENISSLPESNSNENETFGPKLPPHMKSITPESTKIPNSMNEQIVGPLPITDTRDTTASEIELLKRALEIKTKNLESITNPNSHDTIREEWMLELPEVNKPSNIFNLPKSFQTKERPDFTDRTCWANTPSNSSGAKKSLSNKEIYKRNIDTERDKDQDLLAKKIKTKRDKSLLELHKEKLEKEKNKNKKNKTERRPFNREFDMQTTNFDPAKKSKYLANSKLLDTKYSSGKTKYL